MRLFRWFAALLAASLLSVPAQAAMIRYVITGSHTATFAFHENAVPQLIDEPSMSFGWITSAPIDNVYRLNTFVAFIHNDNAGGLEIQYHDGSSYVLAFSAGGPQLFTGTIQNPTLLTGAWDLYDFYVPGNSYRVNAFYAPEPGAWAMLIGGFALTGAALRRRRALRPALA